MGAAGIGLIAGGLGAWLVRSAPVEPVVVTMPPPACEQVPLPDPLPPQVEERVAQAEDLKRRFESGIGRPTPWSEAIVPDHLRPEPLVHEATALLDAVDGQLLVVDCDENPCVLAVQYPTDGPSPWADSVLDDAIQMSSSLPDDDDQTHIRVVVLADDVLYETPGAEARMATRAERILYRLWEELEE